MPASVNSMSRPYSSVSKWIPGRQRCHQRGEARRERDIALDAARNHERHARLVDHQRVGLVHECNVEGPVHEAAGVQGEQVTQVVEAGFLRGDVGDIRRVGGAPRGGHHPLLHGADADPEPAIDRGHPLGIAAREIVVERQDVHAVTGERVERRGHHRRERLAFAGEHLDHLPVVQGERREELHVERALPEGAASGLAGEREEGHAQGVPWLACARAGADRVATLEQRLVAQRLGCALELADSRDHRRVAAQVEADGRTLQAPDVVLEASLH